MLRNRCALPPEPTRPEATAWPLWLLAVFPLLAVSAISCAVICTNDPARAGDARPGTPRDEARRAPAGRSLGTRARVGNRVAEAGRAFRRIAGTHPAMIASRTIVAAAVPGRGRRLWSTIRPRS
jgi:hypothetical protein